MIAFLSGTVAHKGEGVLVMDVGGVGYRLLMAQSSIMALPPVDEDAKVFCSMSVSDAGIFLYGFIDEQERLMFDRLTSINGVGPKMALAALSLYDAPQLAGVIASQDAKALSKVPGIGKKTASRILLELKDAFADAGGNLFSPASTAPASLESDSVAEALASMGFTDAEISAALDGVDPNESESARLQYALRRM